MNVKEVQEDCFVFEYTEIDDEYMFAACHKHGLTFKYFEGDKRHPNEVKMYFAETLTEEQAETIMKAEGCALFC